MVRPGWRMSLWLGGLVAGWLGMAAPALADMQQIGRYNEWLAYREEQGTHRVCYLIDPPVRSEPAMPHRGKAFLGIRREAGKQDLVVLVAGLSLNGMLVEVRINDQPFSFAAGSDGLVATDVDRTLDALGGGGELTLRLSAAGSTILEDHYALMGFGQAYREVSSGCLLLASPGIDNQRPALPTVVAPVAHHEVALHHVGGVATLPVTINGGATLEFVVDSGAAEVAVPAEAFDRLRAAGVISDRDFTTTATFRTADGRTYTGQRFLLHEVSVGGHSFSGVVAHISPRGSPMLLGQTVLGQFHSWSLDNQRGVFVWE